ncbi:hypothetical protein [Chitinophaga nivalis]|uniref:hypothetical protein n=1 Tax=Chitinophaga nivalis TaxID=2991709 RepID=UPI003FCD09D0
MTHTQYVCNGNNASSDKQIIIKLGWVAVSYSTQPYGTTLSIPKFNINNYPGVDSMAIYAAPWGRKDGDSYDTPGPAKLELYNITDATVIENSAVLGTATSSTAPYVPSNNFYTSFPRKEFDLGLRITAVPPSNIAHTSDVIMILYRK